VIRVLGLGFLCGGEGWVGEEWGQREVAGEMSEGDERLAA